MTNKGFFLKIHLEDTVWLIAHAPKTILCQIIPPTFIPTHNQISTKYNQRLVVIKGWESLHHCSEWMCMQFDIMGALLCSQIVSTLLELCVHIAPNQVLDLQTVSCACLPQAVCF